MTVSLELNNSELTNLTLFLFQFGCSRGDSLDTMLEQLLVAFVVEGSQAYASIPLL